MKNTDGRVQFRNPNGVWEELTRETLRFCSLEHHSEHGWRWSGNPDLVYATKEQAQENIDKAFTKAGGSLTPRPTI